MKITRAVVYVTSLLLLSVTAGGKPVEVCEDHPVDVVFILDVSSSIWEVNFKNHVLTFVQKVVGQLDIGPGATHARVGAITFSDDVKLEFRLNQYMDKDVLLEKVSQIALRGGNTDTHEALEYVKDHMFTPANGGRQNVSRVVIVITDGASRKVKDTEAMASALREQGVSLFAIGVGNGVNTTQLHAIASRPSASFVYNVTNYQYLNSIHHDLVNRTCQVITSTTTTTTTTTPTTTTSTTEPSTTTTTTTTPTTTTSTTVSTTTTTPTTTTAPTTPSTSTTTLPPTTIQNFEGYNVNDSPQGDTAECTNHPADIYFVLDSSRSIWVYDFQARMLPFVRDVISLLDVGKDRTRVGIITYSDASHTIFGLHAHFSKQELLHAINKENVKYTPGLTYTAEALQQARINLLNEGRPDVPHVVILITDGQSRDPNATITTARAARNEGVTIFAVGVGVKEGEALDELHAMASQPSEDHVLKVEGFDSLSTHHNVLLAGRACRVNSTKKADRGSAGGGGGMSADGPQMDCQLQHADILLAYDWNILGGTTSAHITATLQHLSTSLRLRAADVTLGTVTSSDCVEHRSIALSRALEFDKRASSVVRFHQSRLPSVLKSLRMQGFSLKNGHRTSAKKVVVIVLDPSSAREGTQVALEAAKIRRDDVEVFVVTSGRHGGHLVYDMVSEPAYNHVVRLPALDFANHAFASELIRKALCGGWRT